MGNHKKKVKQPPSIVQRIINGRPRTRFWAGFALVLIVIVIGFAWVVAVIPNWSAAQADISRALPGDERVTQPQTLWNHAITIHATPDKIYPWLAQIGDTRGGFYSYTFIENLFMSASGTPGRYANANSIHADWQTPATGQGIIGNWMAIEAAQPGQYVLATQTPEMPGVVWSWLWYLDPVDADNTRLIVRHRATFPPEAPKMMVDAVFNAGYVMERGMLRGIRDRAEGRGLLGPIESLDAALWLSVLAIGIAAAVRFARVPGRWHPLGVGLEAVIVLFIFTFIQPDIWLRLVLLLVLAFSLWIGFQPGRVTRRIRAEAHAHPARG